MKHKTLRTLLCVILTVCFCLSAIVPASAAGLFGGDSGAATGWDQLIRGLKDRFIEKNPGTDETPAEPMAGAGTNGFEYKIVFLDCGRKYFSVDSIKKIIDNASAAGFNYVQLAVGNDGMRFLLDDMSLTVNGTEYTSERVSAAIHAGNEAYYNFTTDELTQSEMDTIIAYAKEKEIGIIPCVNTPGHMDAILHAATSLTGKDCSYSYSDRTIDVTSDTAVAFTQAFVQKYIDYFAGKGCTLFNMGADEYANDKFTGGSMGFGNLQSTGNYGSYVDYVNQLATMIKAAGMTPMAFNDGIYFNNNTSSGTFDTDIIICYWSSGWDSYTPMPAATLASKGFKMVNTHGDYYWVLGKSNWQCSPEKASGFNYKTFQGGTIDNPAGAMFCIWCDYPGAGTETSVLNSTKDTIAAFGKTLPDVTPAAPTISGIKDGGNLTIGSSVTLSVSGGADATWTSSDMDVLKLEAVTGDAVAAAVGTVIAQSVKATALKRGSATVTATTADGKTASAKIQVYSETDPVTKNIELVIGEEKTDIQAGDVTGQVGDYDNSIVTITTAPQTIDGTTETSVAKIAMSSYGQYTGVISDGTNYMVVDSNGNITNTDKAENATEFVVTYSKDGYTIKTKDSTYNLNVSVSGNYYTTITLVATDNAATNWSYSSGFNYRYGTSYYNRYYICYLNGSWTVRNNFYSDFTASHLYKVTTTTTEPVNQTTITFKGKAVGTTSVTIGNVLYNITVTDKAPSTALTATSIVLEYWITNNRVYEGQSSNTNFTKTISSTSASSEEGKELTTLAPNPAYSFFDGTVTVHYWQTMRLDSAHKQTDKAGVDQTADGTTLTHVRYHSGAWQYKTVDGTWHYFMTGDQLVAYYLQKTEVTKEIDTYVKDWGYGTSSTTPDTSSNKGQVALTVAVVYPDGSVSPTEANMYANSTTIFNYWAGRDIGIVAPVNNGDYNIAKITVTDGTRDNNTSANVWYTSDTITWDKKTLDDGTKWYNETEVWNKSSGTTPMVNGKNSNITWSAKNTAKLVLIYLETIEKPDNLTVIYYDDNAGAEITRVPVVVGNGVTFKKDLKDGNGNVIGGTMNWPAETAGAGYLPDDAYVTNTSGVNQTFSKQISTLQNISSVYKSGIYKYVSANIDANDDKILILHFNLKNADGAFSFVVDFGLPITILPGDIGITNTNTIQNASLTKATPVLSNEGKYGTATIASNYSKLTYTLHRPLDKIATIPLFVTFTDNTVQEFQINIIPATNVYYEENFINVAENSTVWTDTGTARNPDQALEKSDAQKYVYGYDPEYATATDTYYSMGNAKQATLTLSADAFSTKTSEALTFTFEGDGYDIISECGKDVGLLVAYTYRVENGKETLKYIDIMDNYFCGDDTYITGTDILAAQVPVIRKLNLSDGYGKYKVKIIGYLRQTAGVLNVSDSMATQSYAAMASVDSPVVYDYESSTNAIVDEILADLGVANLADVDVRVSFVDKNSILNGGTGVFAKETVQDMKNDLRSAYTVQANEGYKAGSAVVYVDAFRVYNPLGHDTTNLPTAYNDNHENSLKYESMYDYLKNSGSAVTNNELVDNALIYVEYDGDTNVATVKDYKNQGPDNEIYLTAELNKTNYIGIILQGWTDGISKVMVSAKSVLGNPALWVKTQNNQSKVADVKTKTELYYDLSNFVKWDSTINNWVLVMSNQSNSQSVLSISGIKISKDCSAGSSQFFAESVKDSLTSTGTSTYNPDPFSVTSYGNVLSGDEVSLNVKVDGSANSLKLYGSDGKEVAAHFSWNNQKAYNRGKVTFKSFTIYFDAPTVTTETAFTYKVVAVNADGIESNPIEITITVVQ